MPCSENNGPGTAPADDAGAAGLPELMLVPPDFYDRCVTHVARELLGFWLCRRTRDGLTVGRIVETEAYLAAEDTASHSFRGPGLRNASMFGLPGHAYVYTIHARQCFNVVTQGRGVGSAVLIRSLEPLIGIELMRCRRATSKLRDLCRGPARLCEAMAIGRSFDGWNLMQPHRLWLAMNPQSHRTNVSPSGDCVRICQSPRIGVTSAQHLPLRYFFADNPFVSGPAWLNRNPGTAVSSSFPD